ncbi:hypothetical protein [Bacillus massilioanorexius]|nr:hypothetical protein [Bacillus massilioanorexius]
MKNKWKKIKRNFDGWSVFLHPSLVELIGFQLALDHKKKPIDKKDHQG